jgi:hypothetical protein
LRLRALEAEQRKPQSDPPPRLAPPLEWWSENFALIRDISIRRYPVHVQSYDGLLADPERVVTRALQWLGRGDGLAAREAVKLERRTFHSAESSSVEPDVAAVFDELYATVHAERPLTVTLLHQLNHTNEKLKPLFAEHQQKLARYHAERAGDQTR